MFDAFIGILNPIKTSKILCRLDNFVYFKAGVAQQVDGNIVCYRYSDF
jgi:hypothetical protein